MKYPFIENQTIEYYTLHAMELGAKQAIWVIWQLRKIGVMYKAKQIYPAMQRLRKQGLIERINGLWEIKK